MKPLIILILTTLLIPFCTRANDQSLCGNIYGTVIDKQSQTTLPGVTILAFSNNKSFGTTTDINGRYSIDNIPIGRFDIEFSLIGYEKISMKNVLLTSVKDLYVDIELLEKVENLDEVVVRAYSKDKTINEFATTSARIITVEESNKYAGSWGDPARMVSNFAGVVSAGDQRNDIIIRGNSPTSLLWRLDGIAIPNPNHFGTFGSTGGPISILNNNQLANSDFLTGAFPAEFGNSLSGVFDLKMRNGNFKKHEFMGQMGFNGFELGAEGPISKSKGSSYLVNFRYSMMDLMSALKMFDVGGVPKYADLSLKIFVPTKKCGTFSLIGIGGYSNIKLEDDPDDDEDSGSGWSAEMLPGTKVYNGSKMGLIGLTNKLFLTDKARIESSVSASYSNSFNNVDSIGKTENSNFYNDSYSETTYSFSTKYILKSSAKNSLQIGFTAELFDFNFFDETYINQLNKFVQNTNTDGNAMLYQLYFQSKNRLTDDLTLNWGLHSQLFGLNNSMMVEPRLGLSYAINHAHSINFGYGLHGQIQPRLIYFVQTPVDSKSDDYILTNKELGFSKSHHIVAGYNWSIVENLRFKLEAYYQYLYDVPVEKESSTFSMLNYGANYHNESKDNLVNEGLGKNVGLEITLEKYLNNNFYFLLTSSVYDSKYQGSDKVWRNNAFNGNYTVNFLAGYEIPIKNDVLAFNIKTTWAGGKRYTPIDLDKSITAYEAVYDYNNAFAGKFEDYFKTDLRISFRQNLKKISQEWSFDVQNLTDHKNILTQRFDAASKKLVNVLQMGFFPIGSWKIYF